MKTMCLLMNTCGIILLAYRTESQYILNRRNYIDYNRDDLHMVSPWYTY